MKKAFSVDAAHFVILNLINSPLDIGRPPHSITASLSNLILILLSRCRRWLLSERNKLLLSHKVKENEHAP